MTVQFSGGFHASFTSAEVFACVNITSCPRWEATKQVSWANLPTSKFATFYETDTCRTGGKFFYISDVAKVDGSHKFYEAQAIRSFMFGDNNDFARRPKLINSRCFKKERSSVETTSDGMNQTTAGVVYEIDWVTDTSSSSGGLSANWSKPLPELSA